MKSEIQTLINAYNEIIERLKSKQIIDESRINTYKAVIFDLECILNNN